MPIARSITNSNSHSPPISRFQPPLSGPPTHLPAPSRRLFPDRPSARADSLRSKRRTFPGKHRRPSPPLPRRALFRDRCTRVKRSLFVLEVLEAPCAANRTWTAGYKRDAPRFGLLSKGGGLEPSPLRGHDAPAPANRPYKSSISATFLNEYVHLLWMTRSFGTKSIVWGLFRGTIRGTI